MEATMEKVFINIPSSDLMFFNYFVNKMGWQVNSRQNIWDDYIKTSPQEVNLSDSDIMEAVRAVRYGEV